MAVRYAVLGALALALAGCAGAPVPTVGGGGGGAIDPTGGLADQQAYPDGNTFRLMAVEELPIAEVTADSSSAPVSAIADGNLATQWVNGGYRNATAWAQARLSTTATIGSIGIKTGAMPTGTSYDVLVSTDGTTWTTALANQVNATWNLETKALPANTSGQYVRIAWHNSASAPQPHFSIFELQVNGSSTGGPSPTPMPSVTPTPTPTPTAQPSTGPSQVLVPIATSASSTYANLAAGRAVDGDVNTQWASDGSHPNDESLVLQYDRVYSFDGLQIKTGYLPQGVQYLVEVSTDGTTWTTAGGPFTNTTWNVENKAIVGQGKYLRIHFANYYATMGHYPVFEVKATGKANGTTTVVPLAVPNTYAAVFHATESIGGPMGAVVAVDRQAYNNTPKGLKFPAMIGMQHGTYGYEYIRITPDTMNDWEVDHGGPGPVAFLDDTAGLADNSGAWTFTIHDSSDLYYPVVASAQDDVTTWDASRAAHVDLGPTTRTWRVDGQSADPYSQYDQTPGVIVVYTRPDGTRDFTIGQGNGFLGFPQTIQTQGTVYAFFLTDDGSNQPGYSASVTFTAAN